MSANIETLYTTFDTCEKLTPKPMPSAFARARAERVAHELAPFCEPGFLLITGSTRRCRPLCNDIDIALLPRPMMWPNIRARILKSCALDTDGAERFSALFRDGVKLDIWIARPEERDLLQNRTPTNFGMIVLVSTGSKEHNVTLARRADDMGLHFHPNRGILRDNQVIACETEEQIFAALRLRFIPPEKRE